MRRVIALLTIVIPLVGILSCSDMPTAPRTTLPIEGSVLDRDGAPMSSVGVYFYPTVGPSGFTNYAFTDARGAFKISLLEGDYQVRIASGYYSGYPDAVIPKFTVNRSKPRLDYKFSGTKISGDVTGLGGTPLTGARIACDSGSFETSVSTVSTDGHYSLFVPPGAYYFYVDPPDPNGGMPSLRLQAQVASGDTTMNFSLSGDPVTATATLNGTPVSGVYLEAHSTASDIGASARTSLDGTAVLYLPAGNYYYFAYAPTPNIAGPVQGLLSIPGDTSIPIALPGTKWSITLRRASDNAPIPSVYIRATEILNSATASASADPLGRFQLGVRPNVGYALEIDYPYPSQAGPFFVPYVASTADSTFDLVINAP